jgi:hypothetical protein
MLDFRGQKIDFHGQKTDFHGQKSDFRGQKTDFRGSKSHRFLDVFGQFFGSTCGGMDGIHERPRHIRRA